MSDTSIEVTGALREACRHLHLALDQFCAVNILATYPQAEPLELQINAALGQLPKLAAAAHTQASARVATFGENT